MSKVYIFSEDKIPAIIKAAYSLSSPQGLGFLHFEKGPLPDEDVERITSFKRGDVVFSMDYVRGRSIKLSGFRNKDGSCRIDADRWYDHSPDQLRELARIADLGQPQDSPK